MKKIINDVKDVVPETLKGIALQREDLEYLEDVQVLVKKEKTGNVGIISGGGSGHEPAHAGYVGEGMLDAAVAGNVFSSPSPDRILEAIRKTDSGKGVLMIVKNYSGDIMNFELAQEIAEMENLKVDWVVVKDDVATEDSEDSAGRRAIAGTVFVHKIAGAAAAKGYDLKKVKRIANKTIKRVRTMGMSMSGCTVPANGKPNFEIPEDEMEVGMGIHGEKGIDREKIKPSKQIAKILLDHIFKDKDYSKKEVALMINGLGATPLMELYILNKDVREYLDKKDVKVYKTFVGNYMTAIDMQGCSVTLLELDKELKELLDAPCDTAALVIK